MPKSAWDFTLELLSIMGDIDRYSELLSKSSTYSDRELYSKKIDSLEVKLFDIREKLKKLTVI
ncbi:hypothetical protein [Clostridium sp.]|uniref:hypothetical protein n=1 Tax=Clostridium sp. TaxID=1506 RepID=UPI002613322A|nr:hypothetical protein [Clostridium sp.]